MTSLKIATAVLALMTLSACNIKQDNYSTDQWSEIPGGSFSCRRTTPLGVPVDNKSWLVVIAPVNGSASNGIQIYDSLDQAEASSSLLSVDAIPDFKEMAPAQDYDVNGSTESLILGYLGYTPGRSEDTLVFALSTLSDTIPSYVFLCSAL